MIVTRKRKRRSHAGRWLVLTAVIAAIAAALAWPPSQRIIANGPLRPVWAAGATAGGVVARPFTFAAQQQTIADRNREVRELNLRLEAQRKAKADTDARADQLQRQVASLQAQPVETPEPAPRPVPTPAPAGFAAAPGAAGGNAALPTPEEKRLAATWAAMEPDKAAAVVQRLPDDEITRVLAQMDPDSAGSIMDALPTAVAARISRAVAQVQPAAGR